MDTLAAVPVTDSVRLRPTARWEQRQDDTGRSRLVMVWSVPDPDTALSRLATTDV